MPSGATGLESVQAGKAGFAGFEEGFIQENSAVFVGNATSVGYAVTPDNSSDRSVRIGANGEPYPTDEEIATLPRVRGKIDYLIYSIAFVELCERFAYYGTTAVFVNFIQWPLPKGSTTGAAGTYGQPGALGMGQRASTGLTLLNSFWSYIMPMVCGYLADTYWGRFEAINVAIAIAVVGHIIIIISAIPQVIDNQEGAWQHS